MSRLDNRGAVITGAASGIGRSTAIRFAREGASVVIADLDREGGEAVVQECKENGGNAVFQLTDVSREEDVKRAVDRAVKEFGRLDIIFNNAGIGGAAGPIETISVENWDRTCAILLRAVFLGMKYAIPEMRKLGGGSIISTSSIGGLRHVPGPAPIDAYSAAKGGVINLTRAVAVQLAKDKIRVNCICPGFIATPLVSGFMGEDAAKQVLAGSQPWPRAGLPEDIAATALFLASDDSEFITGQTIVVDGGVTSSVGSVPSVPSESVQGDQWFGPSFQMRPS